MWNYVDSSNPTLGNSLFGAIELVKNADIDKYKYSGYSIGFDVKGTFGFPAIGFGRNVTIFGADMDSSVHIDNKKKDLLIFGKGTTIGLDDATLAAEKMYLINFTEHNKTLCLGLYYNGVNSHLFVNGTEIIKFKAKDSETVETPLCLRNASKIFSVNNMKNTGFYGYVYEFSVD